MTGYSGAGHAKRRTRTKKERIHSGIFVLLSASPPHLNNFLKQTQSKICYHGAMFSKIVAIAKAYIQRGLTFRFTVISYRIGELLEMVVLIVMWSAIFEGQEMIRGFTLPEMVTYVLFGNLAHILTRNFIADLVPRQIKTGKLSQYLIQPISYFTYLFSQELGRIFLALILSIFTQLCAILLFSKYFIVHADIPTLCIIAIMLLLAFCTELLLNFLFSMVSFWTLEVDGLFSTIERLKKFFAGGYFPLNLLPSALATLSFFLPFAYTFYVPALLYLGKMDIGTGLKGLLIQTVWIGILASLIFFIWKRGLRRYEGVGI